MARFPFESSLVDQLGRIVVVGTVTVNLSGTSTAATVYAAETGSADADVWVDATGATTHTPI